MAKNAVFGGVHHLKLSVFLRGGSMKSLPQLWQISSPRDVFCVQVQKPLLVCTITAFQQTRFRPDSDPIPKTIDHVIPKVDGTTLEPGYLNGMVIK